MLSFEQPKLWANWLYWPYWYNTTYQGSAGCISLELVHGRKPPILIHYLLTETLMEAIVNDLRDRDEVIIRLLTYHLQRTQNKMRQSTKRHWRDVSFDMVEWGYIIKVRAHHPQYVPKSINPKLSPIRT